INLFTSGKLTWAVWPILGWGIGLAFHAWAALNSDSESFQEEFEQFRRKQARKNENRPV
ncbi:MAG: 2TM domain-containing protein, partial [Armatimonadetes bacterium]|nr:2TM domain-containing protein [Armatimonadota bacterium]